MSDSSPTPEPRISVLPHPAEAERISVCIDGREVGHLLLYYMTNDQHSEPCTFCEDWFVEEQYRKQGIGELLAREAIRKSREHGCYKVIANSRFGRDHVHRLLEACGYTKHGYEFRVDAGPAAP
ncbi:GNAT family N-acetyltransferase [Actinacidiphila rubida]|uniref:Acetyltransferase (GNAT) family protein n=1 Tax=Actinacidiphila rubida TaxID=310780 RepID=A0A1H8K9E4_9ACTN|nr:GNAT family N-acetyltransferase [Actinacidiphila rubida]SEN89583.1 Acetyltransferase (GNAT) family protein [Actinacidiphila rubida]